MRNPFRKKSTLEKTVEDKPRALKTGLAAAAVFVGIIVVSAVVSKTRSGQEETE